LVFDNLRLHILKVDFQNMTTSINQSLAHGLGILLLYDDSTSFLTVAEISRRLGYSQSKSYRLVRTLIKYGLIQENDTKAQYSLGLNAFRIGLLARQQFNIAALARPFMEELSSLTNETILLTAVNGTKGICLERIDSAHPIRYSSFGRGGSFALHCGAASKILMAYLPEEKWDQIIRTEGLRRFTQNTITSEVKLKDHLREIRRKGYAYSDQEVDQDVIGVAAPIFDGIGELVAGLCIVGPVYRIKRKINSYGKLVMQYAQKVSVKIGYKPIKRDRTHKLLRKH
jgi:IclR family KDG regulon transcriptional repressor